MKTKEELKEEYENNRLIIKFKEEDLNELEWFENTTILEAKEKMLKRFSKLESIDCINQKIVTNFSDNGYRYFSVLFFGYETFDEYYRRYQNQMNKEIIKKNNAERIFNNLVDDITDEFKQILLNKLKSGI